MYTLDVLYLWCTHGVTIDQESAVILTFMSIVLMTGSITKPMLASTHTRFETSGEENDFGSVAVKGCSSTGNCIQCDRRVCIEQLLNEHGGQTLRILRFDHRFYCLTALHKWRAGLLDSGGNEAWFYHWKCRKGSWD